MASGWKIPRNCKTCGEKRESAFYYRVASKCKKCCIADSKRQNWIGTHPERVKYIQKQWQQKHSRAWTRTPKARYDQLVWRAKYRRLEITLSMEQWLQIIAAPCYYCGGSLPETGSGLDRIDSTLGYHAENVRPCCRTCNTAKLNLAENTFKEWARNLFHHYASR